jgi:adenosylcobinamide kinase/adenosylcobinamide-phosphate guanylyltransferase
MTHLLLVLGGGRSGKSAYAEQRVDAAARDDVAYIATLLPGEPDVDARIAVHRGRRPDGWHTVEAGDDVTSALRAAGCHEAVLLDGFELALALAELPSDEEARRLADSAATSIRKAARSLGVVVSTEAGLGVVPASAAGVLFRDRLGAANQTLAAHADEVVLVIAGLPLHLKGGPR